MKYGIPTRRVARSAALAALLLASMMVGSGSASAAITMSVTTPAGVVDPVEDLPRVFRIDGLGTGAEDDTYVRYRSGDLSATPCATRPENDTGDWLVYGSDASAGTLAIEKTFESSGTFSFCIWRGWGSYTAARTPNPIPVTFRDPTGSMTHAFSAQPFMVGAGGSISVTISTEAGRYAYASDAPAGTPCALTWAADPGTNASFIDTWMDGGTETFTRTISADSAPGSYRTCVWLTESTSDTAPINGGAYMFEYAVQRPTCRFPAVRGKTVLAAKAKIRTAGCRPSRWIVRRVAGRGVARGKVLKANFRPAASVSKTATVVLYVRR